MFFKYEIDFSSSSGSWLIPKWKGANSLPLQQPLNIKYVLHDNNQPQSALVRCKPVYNDADFLLDDPAQLGSKPEGDPHSFRKLDYSPTSIGWNLHQVLQEY